MKTILPVFLSSACLLGACASAPPVCERSACPVAVYDVDPADPEDRGQAANLHHAADQLWKAGKLEDLSLLVQQNYEVLGQEKWLCLVLEERGEYRAAGDCYAQRKDTRRTLRAIRSSVIAGEPAEGTTLEPVSSD